MNKVGDKFAVEKEIIKELCSPKRTKCGGATLYFHNAIGYVNNSEGHTNILGGSGQGKSRRMSYPTCASVLNNKESLIAVDPKGELYKYTACYAEENHQLICIDFRNLLYSVRWNPLHLITVLYHSGNPEDKERAEAILDELSHNLYPTPENQDPFWIHSARSVFIGVVHALLDYAEPEEINICNVYNFIATGEERLGASTYLKEFVNMLPKDSVESMLLLGYVTTASDTKAGIRSVFLEGLSLFVRSEGLKRFTSYSDLKIDELLGDKPVAIYIIIPDESPVYDDLAGVLVSQLLTHFISIAQNKYDGVLPCRLNILLEELGNIGKAISNLPHLMSAGRSRNIRIYMILQSLSQLKDIYGESKTETILGNVSTTVAFSCNNYDTLERFSNICGSRYIKVDKVNQKEPLITASQLGAMEIGQALIILNGRLRYITKLPDYEEVYKNVKLMKPINEKTHDDISVRYFDLQKLVKEMKRKEMDTKDARDSLRAPFNPFRDRNGDMEDIDEVIARIDREIAKLEAEEKEAEKEKEKEKKKPGRKKKEEE